MSDQEPTEQQKRIFAIMERREKRGCGVCPLCGFRNFNGGLHPWAGNQGKRSETSWCTGKVKIPAKEPRRFEWQCPRCQSSWKYTQAELEHAEQRGICHDCEATGSVR